MIFFIWLLAVRSDVSHCQRVRMLSTPGDFHLFLLLSLEYNIFVFPPDNPASKDMI